MVDVVLAIDPGRMKCGVAVVRRDGFAFEAVCMDVVDSVAIGQTIIDLVGNHHPGVILIGDGTASSEIVNVAISLGLVPVKTVDEKNSTLLARERFFRENPPKGLHRLLPTSLQTPNRPYDDYVAVLLAENYLSGK